MRKRKFIHRFGFLYRPIKKRILGLINTRRIRKETLKFFQQTSFSSNNRIRVFYLGITAHSNLGDMAQYYCIKKWITENYPNAELIELESNTVVDKRFHFMDRFKSVYRPQDIIVFQSGYTTQDLGGNHDLMHRIVCDALPFAHILMMPQTILFKDEKNRLNTSLSYNSAKNMLFLARDRVSYEQAIKMFPDINVRLFPDIVTSLIGMYSFTNTRKGVCLCVRDDGEKFYSDDEIEGLQKDLEMWTNVKKMDTTIDKSFMEIRENIKEYIEGIIQHFSKYEVTITDRYHGTIFSLIAGTPVIIIKSNDHKVVTGADWFKDIYVNYVHIAKDLDDAKLLCRQIEKQKISYCLKPYFAENYYQQLKEIFTLTKTN